MTNATRVCGAAGRSGPCNAQATHVLFWCDGGAAPENGVAMDVCRSCAATWRGVPGHTDCPSPFLAPSRLYCPACCGPLDMGESCDCAELAAHDECAECDGTGRGCPNAETTSGHFVRS